MDGRQVSRRLVGVAAALTLGGLAQADVVTQVVSQGADTGGRHWMLQANATGQNYWSNGLAATNLHDYIVGSNMVLRTPEGAGEPAFTGKSLQLDAFSTLGLKLNYGQDAILQGDLLLNGGAIAAWLPTTGASYQYLDLNNHTLSVLAASSFNVNATDTRRIALRNAVLTGSAGLTLDGGPGDSLRLEPTVNGSGYTGPWTLNGGTLLVVSNATAFGTADGPTMVNTRSAEPNATSLQLQGAAIAAEPLTLDSQGALRTRLTANAGINAWGGPITVNGNGTVMFAVEGAATRLTLAGPISGTNTTIVQVRGGSGLGVVSGGVNLPNATFNKTDANTWRIDSTGNRWRGGTIAVGTLQLGADDALPTTNVVNLGQANATGALDLNGFRQTVAGLNLAAGTGRVGNSSTSSDSVLRVSAGTSTYPGSIQDALGTGTRQTALVVTDGATLTLTGVNTYNGATTVSNAMLLVAGKVVSPVTVKGGGVYGGGGTCSNLTVAAGGTHAPGRGAIGTDRVLANYALDGALTAEVNGAAGGTADRVSVVGTLTLGATSTLTLAPTNTLDDQLYILADYGSRSGAFAATNGLPADYALRYDYGARSNLLVLARTDALIWAGALADKTWGQDANWQGGAIPPTNVTDTIWFTAAGSVTNRGPITSYLEQDRTVATLHALYDGGSYHTLDLTGRVLRVTGALNLTSPGFSPFLTLTNTVAGGAVVVSNGNVYVGYNGGSPTLSVNAPFTVSGVSNVVEIGRREGPGTSNTVATLNLSNAGAVRLDVGELRIGAVSPHDGGTVRGIVYLSDRGTNTLTATRVTMGESPWAGIQGVVQELHLGGGTNLLSADVVTVANKKCSARVDVDAGGRVVLRGRSKPAMTLRVGINDATGTGTVGTGTADFQAGRLDAWFDELRLGEFGTGAGGGVGNFLMADGEATASNVVLAVTTAGSTAPAATQGNLTLNGGTFTVQNAITDGGGASTLAIRNGTLTVARGLTVDTLVAGQGGANGLGAVTAAGAVRIGAGTQTVTIGAYTVNSSTGVRGVVDLTAATSVVVNVANLNLGVGGGNPGTYGGVGTLRLSPLCTNTLAATTVTIGHNNGAAQTAEWSKLLAAGTTTLDATTLYVGRAKSLGELSLATPGRLTVGAAAAPVTFIGVGYNDAANTGAVGNGLLSCSNGAVQVYAGTLHLGHHFRNTAPGGGSTGRLVVDSMDDLVVATNRIVVGGPGGTNGLATGILTMTGGTVQTPTLLMANAALKARATGIVNLGGGTLFANTIQRGATNGTSTFTFNWTGGNLVVGAFTEPLVQRGGALVPGNTNALGQTTVTGDYTVQAGTWRLDVDGAGSGAADRVIVGGALTLGATTALEVTALNKADDAAYVIAEYGSLTGTFGTQALPPSYSVNYRYGAQGNQIAVVYVPGTLLILK